MLVPSVIAGISAALFAALTYSPYQAHLKLHGVELDPSSAEQPNSLNLNSCHSVFARALSTPATPAEASFCDDVHLHRQSGMAYFSCDPSRLTWDARRGVWDDFDSPAQHGEQGQGAIWAWDTAKNRHPRKMFISFPPPGSEIKAPVDLHSSFHPLGISVTVANPYYLPESLSSNNSSSSADVPALVVLVANHPQPHRSGVVDVFVHDLDGVGGRDNTVLRWIKRIEGSELHGQDGTEEAKTSVEINPFRIAVFDEQHAASIPRAYPLPGHSYNISEAAETQSKAEFARNHIRIPSFFVTSLPTPGQLATKDAKARSPVYSTYFDYILSLLLPSHLRALPDPAARLWIHHSSVAKTMAAQLDGGMIDAWAGFPPLLQVWDGNGEQGGSNTTASSLFVPRTESNWAGVGEWEQHWVRGISWGIKPHEVKADQEGTLYRLINTYTPSFVSFWKKSTTFPVRAITLDALGRLWTAGTRNTQAAEAWIEHRVNERRRQLGSPYYRPPVASASGFVSTPARPASQIEQLTYLYRPLVGTALHPWNLKERARLKKEGIFVKKEFLASPVFKQGAETEAEAEARSVERYTKRGFLPSIPTAMAVDHERGFLIVVGAYEERGVAKCSIPEGWAEK